MSTMSKLIAGSKFVAAAGLLVLFVAAGVAGCAPLAPNSGTGSGSLETLATVAASDLQPADLSSGRQLKLTATTGLLAEAVRAVGGPWIDLSILVPTGGDPHDYELSPQDVVKLNQSDVVFMSGLGYEVFLTQLLGGTQDHPPVVALSDGITPLTMADELASQPAAAGEAEPGEVDPHVWFDPNSVMQWTENARQALSALDPAHADRYRANAADYTAQLKQLDQWAADQVAGLPESNRKLVADHEVLGYLARRYGFTVVGAITPETSDVAEPSAQQVAALEATLEREGVRVVFVGVFDNHSLADQIGSDMGVSIVPIYLESLSPADGPAATYLDFMQFNITQIVEALK